MEKLVYGSLLRHNSKSEFSSLKEFKDYLKDLKNLGQFHWTTGMYKSDKQRMLDENDILFLIFEDSIYGHIVLKEQILGNFPDTDNQGTIYKNRVIIKEIIEYPIEIPISEIEKTLKIPKLVFHAIKRLTPQDIKEILKTIYDYIDEFNNLNDEDIIVQNIEPEKINLKITGPHVSKSNHSGPKKTDYERASKNKNAVGKKGEEVVKEYLEKNGYTKVKIVANEDDTLGYDISCVDQKGIEKLIEVKTKSTYSSYINFYISDNELQKYKNNENHEIWYLFKTKTGDYKIYEVDKADFFQFEDSFKTVYYKINLDYEVKH